MDGRLKSVLCNQVMSYMYSMWCYFVGAFSWSSFCWRNPDGFIHHCFPLVPGSNYRYIYIMVSRPISFLSRDHNAWYWGGTLTVSKQNISVIIEKSICVDIVCSSAILSCHVIIIQDIEVVLGNVPAWYSFRATIWWS
jgi:hypothetical protein